MGLNRFETGVETHVEMEPSAKSLNRKKRTLYPSLPSLQHLGKELRDCGFLRKGEKVEEAVKRLDVGDAEALRTVIHAIRRSQRGSGKNPSKTGIVGNTKVLNPNTYLAEQISKLEKFLADKLTQRASDNIHSAMAATRSRALGAIGENA